MGRADDLLTGLGVALRERRNHRQVTQEWLHLETGVHRTYIGGIERGERAPGVATIIKLADGLDVPVSKLFERAEELSA